MKMAKVKCSGCGNDMDCPETMIKAEKHYCHICVNLLADGVTEKDLKNIAKGFYKLEKYSDDKYKVVEGIFNALFEKAIPQMML